MEKFLRENERIIKGIAKQFHNSSNLKGKYEVDDLIQIQTLHLINKYEEVKGMSSAFIKKTCKNALINYIKADRYYLANIKERSTATNVSLNMTTQNKDGSEVEAIDLIEDKSDPIETLLTRELIKELIKVLNEKEKTIIVLRYFEGLQFSEIAERLNIKRNTVQTIERRALNKLRQKASDLEC